MWEKLYLSFNIARTVMEAVAIIIVIMVRCATSNIIIPYLKINSNSRKDIVSNRTISTAGTKSNSKSILPLCLKIIDY